MSSSRTTFTHEQTLAIETLKGPIALLASAGSGKTSVLVERYLKLLDSGLKPNEILTLSFTTESANELKKRVLNRLKNKELSEKDLSTFEAGAEIATLHSFCYQLLLQFGSHQKLPPLSQIVDSFLFAESFQNEFIKLKETLSVDNEAFILNHFSESECRNLARLLVRNRHSIPKNLDPESKNIVDLFKPLIQNLETHWHGLGAYTFNDLEHYALQILQSSENVRVYYQKKFKAILVDEYQDTSRTQYNLLSLVIGNDWEKVFVVGDPKQSIYGFRQADLSVFEETLQLFSSKNGQTLELNTNFRSAKHLLIKINELGSTLFKEATVPFLAMVPPESSDSNGQFISHEYPAVLSQTRKEIQSAELKAVVTEVEALIKRGAPADSIALLFRNGDRIESYAKAIQDFGIPTTSQRNISLFKTYAVLDIIHFLRAVENPLDDFSLAAFLRSPYIGMSYQALAEIKKPDSPLFESLLISKFKNLDWFFALVESGEYDFKNILFQLFNHSSYFPPQGEAVHALFSAFEKPLNLSEALHKIQSYETEDILIEYKTQIGGVRLLTTHAAKGLEFDHVFLADMIRQSPKQAAPVVFSNKWGIGFRYKKDEEVVFTGNYETIQSERITLDLEEAKRILYVALSRPKISIHLFFPTEIKSIPKGSWLELLTNAIIEQSP